MAARTETFDLARLQLRAGEARRLELEVRVEPPVLGTDTYEVVPDPVPVVLDVVRMVGGGHSLRLRYSAAVVGPCMRCLQPAEPTLDVDAREVHEAGTDVPDLMSPYVEGDLLDLEAWARDALLLELGPQVLHAPDCRGLCPECGVDLNVEPDHEHERPPDPRWAALRELKLEEPGT
jgi:uncharacterized protein